MPLSRRPLPFQAAGLLAALLLALPPDDARSEFTCLTPPVRIRTAAAPPALGPDGATDDGSLVDVLVVFTPAAATASTGPIQNQIQAWIDETNGFCLASGVAHRVRLVHSESINYTTTGNILTDIDRLRDKTDGFLDSVHPLRDIVDADLVFLVVATGSAGVGYQMDVLSTSFEDSAFSVITLTEESRVFAHEAGHNMGLGHDHTPGAQAVLCDAFGYRNAAPEQFRTIMSSPPGQKIDLFSSPALSAGGFPLGISGAGCPNDAADAVSALSETVPFVSNFRVSEDGGSAFEDLGFAHPGGSGPPVLLGQGTLVPGFDMSLTLSAAAPSSTALLFVAFGSTPVTFKGGTLAAFPFAITISLGTSPAGDLMLPFPWPVGIPEGTTTVFQFAIADAGASKGVALSNAVVGTAR